MTASFELECVQHSARVPVIVCKLKGRLDTESYQKFQDDILELINSGANYLVFDLGQLAYISSAGLRSIHVIVKALSAQRGKTGMGEKSSAAFKSAHLKLLNPSRNIIEVLELMGFNMFLEIYNDLDRAIASFFAITDELKQSLRTAGPEADETRRGLLRGRRFLFVMGCYPGKRPMYERVNALGASMVMLDGPGHWTQTATREEGLFEDYLEVDLNPTETLAERAFAAIQSSGYQFDGVASFDDSAGPLVALLAEALGLPGHALLSVGFSKNKVFTREVCVEAGIPTPRFFRIKSAEDLEAAAAHVGFPAVLKPISGFSSIATYLITDWQMLEARYLETLNSAVGHLKTSSVHSDNDLEMIWARGFDMTLEEYLDGEEFDVDMLLSEGEPVYAGVTRDLTEPTHLKEAGSQMPPDYPLDRQEEMIAFTRQVLAALEFRDGTFHVELKYTSNGPRLIEVNARIGGGPIYYFHREVWGVDLVEQYLLTRMGVPIRPQKAPQPLTCLLTSDLPSPLSGVVTNVDFLRPIADHPQVLHAKTKVEVGQRIIGSDRDVPDWLGEIMVYGATVEAASQAMSEILARIELPIAPVAEEEEVAAPPVAEVRPVAAPVAPGNSVFSILRNRNFTLLWMAQLITEMGSSLTALATSIYVFKVTGSALNVGLMMMASSLPSLVVGLLAGVFVDRHDRKKIMLVSEFLRVGLTLAIPFLLPFNIAWMYLLVALSATVGQFFNPAHASVLPEIATEEELNAANSLVAISSFGSQVVGYALAGLIVALYPIEWAFYLDALTFLVSFTLIRMAHIPAIQAEEKTDVSSIIQNLKSGLGFIRSTDILRSLFVAYFFIGIIFGFSNAIRLPFSIKALGATEFEFGLLESVTLVGFVIASLLMAKVGDRLREGQWLAISFISMAITGIAFSLSQNIWLAFAIIAVEGFVNAPSVIARALIIQRNTPREARGRVFSAFFVTRDVMFMLGMGMAGLADIFDVRVLYLLSSVVILLAGIYVLVVPGLGLPAAEWGRAFTLLRTAPEHSGLGIGRVLTSADFDRLLALVPPMREIKPEKQKRLLSVMTLHEVKEGTAIIRRHDRSEDAFFILEGQAFAGLDDGATKRILETLRPGDFFGEIAALTGALRTADVIADRPTTVARISGHMLREISTDPQFYRILFTRMTERMIRTDMIDVTRLGQSYQQALRDLRTVS